MSPLKLWFVIPLVFAGAALAQGTAQKGAGASNQPQRSVGSTRTPVAIQPPTNNPFQNPIGQGVAPAASANSSRNNNSINTQSSH
jgi:ABC-type sugar transport system substrate-binding protein